MIKKLLFILSAIFILAFTACGTHPTSESNVPLPASPPSVDVQNTVNIVFTYIAFDDSVVTNEYLQELKDENPDYINVTKYDDTHYTVTILESNRKEMLTEINANLETELEDALSENELAGIFTQVKIGKEMREVSLYADKIKYDAAGFSTFAAPIVVLMTADIVQSYNLIDIEDRGCNVVIYDADTGAVLFPVD